MLLGDGPMIFVAGDIIQLCVEKLASYSNGEYKVPEKLSKILGEYYLTQEAKIKLLKSIATTAMTYLDDQLYYKHKKSYQIIRHTSSFCPWNIEKTKVTEAIDYFFQIGIFRTRSSRY